MKKAPAKYRCFLKWSRRQATLRAHPVDDTASKMKRRGRRLHRAPSECRVGHRKSKRTVGSNPRINKTKKESTCKIQVLSKNGRGDRIRTCGLCVPNAALYQTEPRLDILNFIVFKDKLFIFSALLLRLHLRYPTTRNYRFSLVDRCAFSFSLIHPQDALKLKATKLSHASTY